VGDLELEERAISPFSSFYVWQGISADSADVEGLRPVAGLTSGFAAAQLDKKSQVIFLDSDSARPTMQNRWISQNAPLLASAPLQLMKLCAMSLLI
jgi:hypothetical protein